ncbi:MAG: type II secretion system protein GspN, partial [Desulfobulbaceae bacterium]|nr:type II secretion system protein GspN [Desulfobulbaceae bacterium]
MKNIFGKFSAILGYLLYGGVVLILLLWLLFPTDALKSYTEARGSQFTPAWQLHIGEFRFVHPLFLRIRNCDLFRPKNNKSLFHIDTISLKPDIIPSLRELQPRFLYEMRMLDGVVTGKLKIEPRGKKVDLSADFKNIHPDMAEALSLVLGRQIHGIVTGKMHYNGDLHTPEQGDLQIELRATEGEIALLQPILGLGQLAFKSVSANFSGSVNELEVSNGKIDTPL